MPQNIFNKIKSIAPGIPNNPTRIADITFSPIWNPNDVPTILIIQIMTPPNNECNTKNIIFFIGSNNTFPNINKKIIQVIKETIKVISIIITCLKCMMDNELLC